MVQRISERTVWMGAVAIVLIGVAGVITYTRVELLIEAVRRVSDTQRIQYSASLARPPKFVRRAAARTS